MSTCPYKTIFEPSAPPDAERLSKNQDIPRPFVFRAPQTKETRFEHGERFEFGLVLIGCAFDFLPHFVLSFRELADQGLGLNRAKCILECVENVGLSSNGTGRARPVYNAAAQLFCNTRPVSVGRWISKRLSQFPSAGQRVTIRFLTPTLLRAEGEIIRRPEFHHIFKRLRDRINALCAFFGDGPLDVDFRGLGERAERVRAVSSQIEWVERFRTSSKTHQRHELSGFVGGATYEGNLMEFLLWLLLGELVHVGKHAAWGNGWYRILAEDAKIEVK